MNGDITSEALCNCQLITTKNDATLIIHKNSYGAQPCNGPTLRELVSWCFTALSAQKNYIIAIEVENVSHRAEEEHKYHATKQQKNTINQHNHKLSSARDLWRRSRRHGQASSEESF